MAKQIRFKEAVIEITVSGQRLGGSMLKVTDFRLTPDAEISKTMYAGEKRATPDLDVRGYDFNFSHHKRDRVWWTLWDRIQSAEENGDELPGISLAVTDSYRDGSGLTIVLHGETVMKMDGDERSQGDYQSVSWSGFSQYANGLPT